MLSWLFSRAEAATHAGAAATVSRWSVPAMRQSSTSMAGYFARFLADGRPGWMPWGEMLLSWSADDRIAGVVPELTNAMWNTPAALEDQVFFSPYPAFQPLAIPDFAISRGLGEVSFQLGAPDVRFLDLTASANDDWSFLPSVKRAGASVRTALAILRLP
jgi:hypothetical protein